jgi:mono/diheme cytochrome c family protein
MKLILAYLLITCLSGFLAGCDDMHHQPSIKPQEPPRRSAPAEAIPVQGKQIVTWQSQLVNPVTSTEASVQRGEELFGINCAMCHGTRDSYLGKIGKLLTPPPPSLHDARIKNLSDGDLFKRISLGFGRMPAFQNQVSAIDRWHVVNYMRTFH